MDLSCAVSQINRNIGRKCNFSTPRLCKVAPIQDVTVGNLQWYLA